MKLPAMPRRVLSLAAIALLLVTALPGCSPVTVTLDFSGRGQDLEATVVERDSRGTLSRVAVIDVSGLILNSEQTGLLSRGENPVAYLHERLNEARADRRVKAVILRINSPGGTVTASDAMYRQVLQFKADTHKPVIVLMTDVAASGGYYLACAADHIVAHPTSITGSIGVIVQTVSFKPLLDRVGINAQAITSGANKDVGSPLSYLSPEHRAILQRLVDDFYTRFTKVVRESRPKIPADRFAQLTDGRVLSGSDARDAGLVDDVGDIYDAWTIAKQRAGIQSAHLVLYHRKLQRVTSPYTVAAGAQDLRPGATQINLAQFNLPDGLQSSAGFYYLWQPSVGP